jgi:hypothetical protein
MDSKARLEFGIALAHRIPLESTAAQTADAALELWAATAASLVPIFGPRGFAALFKRSVQLAASKHPWLADLAHATDMPVEAEALRSAVSKQTSPEAAHGSRSCFMAFHDLLGSLVGPHLIERLLRKAWMPSSRPLEALPGGKPATPVALARPPEADDDPPTGERFAA